MFCSNCGHEITGNFCSNCGAPREKTNDTYTDNTSVRQRILTEPVDLKTLLKHMAEIVSAIKYIRSITTGLSLNTSKNHNR